MNNEPGVERKAVLSRSKGQIRGQELRELVPKVVPNHLPEYIGDISLDVRLDNLFWVESREASVFDIGFKKLDLFEEIEASEYLLMPGEFVKAQLRDYIRLPNNIAAQFTLRSAIAQQGLEQSTSIWMRPNWEGNLILELKSFLRWHPIKLKRNLRVGQINFFEV